MAQWGTTGAAVKPRRTQRGWYRNTSEKLRGIFFKRNLNSLQGQANQGAKALDGKYIRRLASRNTFNKRKFKS